MIDEIMKLLTFLKDFFDAMSIKKRIAYMFIMLFCFVVYNIDKFEPYIDKYIVYREKSINIDQEAREIIGENKTIPEDSMTILDENIMDISEPDIFTIPMNVDIRMLSVEDKDDITNILYNNGLFKDLIKKITINIFVPLDSGYMGYQGRYTIYNEIIDPDYFHTKNADAFEKRFYPKKLVPIFSSFKRVEYTLKDKILLIHILDDKTHETFYVWDDVNKETDLVNIFKTETVTNPAIYTSYDINYALSIPFKYKGEVIGFMILYIKLDKFPNNEAINNIIQDSKKSLRKILPILVNTLQI